MAVVVAQQGQQIGGALAHQVLHVALGLPGRAGESQVDVDEVFGQALQGAEVGQFLLRACTKEQQELATFELAAVAQPAPPLGHGAHGSAAGAGADHHDVRSRVVGHEEAAAERPHHLHLVAHLQVAHIVGGHATHRVAIVVHGHALHGQRQVVVSGAFTVAWAGHRVLARVVRFAQRIGARRDDANRLPFQHRERHAAEVEHHMVGFALKTRLGSIEVADHGGSGRVFGRKQIGVRMRGGPRRHRGSVLGRPKHLRARLCRGPNGLLWCC